MDIRQLQYLVALARERHFSRAARACNVTQPTLSGRIRQLEDELGLALVTRGRRFHSLTPEGERVLIWARRIVEDAGSLAGEVAASRGGTGGRLVLGVIPSALPAVAPLTRALRTALPGITLTVLSRSSNEILAALGDFADDAGITYLDNEPVAGMRVRRLYTERYRLFVRPDHPLARRARVGWAEAAAWPLCLLTPSMQNRRIVDATFRAAGAVVVPAVESTSVVALAAHVREAGLATVLPEHYAGVLGAGLAALPLDGPDVAHAVGLVALERDPMPRLVAALFDAAEATAPAVLASH